MLGSEPDVIRWKGLNDLKCSLKSAYLLRDASTAPLPHTVWQAIHRYKGLPKIKAFLWYVILELDSVAAVGVVRKGYNGPHNFRSHLVELWRRPWHVQVVLVKGQGN
ncbi:hypothetical protein V6N12_036300 [Hibiscus sabdariffa]|uniref:Reverse transcriptase zinc-binding domain-containing protein n=1 Tax=Hibiscus sabdariffa TaxID=183260 RepID=A0ABR2ES49_9ROSI